MKFCMDFSADNDPRTVQCPEHLRWNYNPREKGHFCFTNSQMGFRQQHRQDVVHRGKNRCQLSLQITFLLTASNRHA